MISPFTPSTSKPGTGTIHVALLPPKTPVLQTLSYQYPLKLIAPSSITSQDDTTVHTVFMLTYGGGLVAGDKVDLRVDLEKGTRLVLLTQGSTKVFKTPDPNLVSEQRLVVKLSRGSALCYLPDPVQPFAESAFEQVQKYYLPLSKGVGGSSGEPANLCACDWVSHGRGARGENWDFHTYVSRNEVWLDMETDTITTTNGDSCASNKKPRLVLRDNILLSASQTAPNLALPMQVDHLGIFGTLILHGPLFSSLSAFLLQEFREQPRIGARVWGDEALVEESSHLKWRKRRLAKEVKDGVLWTAASVRGLIVIKFGAREVEGAKGWLRDVLEREGSVEGLFGEKALLCLR